MKPKSRVRLRSDYKRRTQIAPLSAVARSEQQALAKLHIPIVPDKELIALQKNSPVERTGFLTNNSVWYDGHTSAACAVHF